MKRWLWSIAVSIDQLGHTLFSPILFYRVAHEDETISSRLGKIKWEHGDHIPWKYPLAKIIDKGLERIDPGHSVNSIEADEE